MAVHDDPIIPVDRQGTIFSSSHETPAQDRRWSRIDSNHLVPLSNFLDHRPPVAARLEVEFWNNHAANPFLTIRNATESLIYRRPLSRV